MAGAMAIIFKQMIFEVENSLCFEGGSGSGDGDVWSNDDGSGWGGGGDGDDNIIKRGHDGGYGCGDGWGHSNGDGYGQDMVIGFINGERILNNI